jgi:hypothetical protein
VYPTIILPNFSFGVRVILAMNSTRKLA